MVFRTLPALHKACSVVEIQANLLIGMNCTVMNLCSYSAKFISSNITDVYRNCRAIYLTVLKMCLLFFRFNHDFSLLSGSSTKTEENVFIVFRFFFLLLTHDEFFML